MALIYMDDKRRPRTRLAGGGGGGSTSSTPPAGALVVAGAAPRPAPPPRPPAPPPRIPVRSARRGRPARGMRGMGDMAGPLDRIFAGPRPYDALVIGTPAGMSQGELWRMGMAGMSGPGGNLLDTLTGGALSKAGGKLSTLEMGLKLAIGASLFAGATSLLLLLQNRRRA